MCWISTDARLRFATSSDDTLSARGEPVVARTQPRSNGSRASTQLGTGRGLLGANRCVGTARTPSGWLTPRGHDPTGFTLVETLVVLVVVSLAFGIVAAGMGQAVRLQQRAAALDVLAERDALGAARLREIVAGLAPDHAGQPGVFRGTERRLTGLNRFALTGAEDGAGSFRLELIYERASDRTRLEYVRDDAEPVRLMVWSGNSGRFRFMSEEGELRDLWPPLAEAAQFPAAIVLERDDAMPIIAAPGSYPVALPKLIDIIEG